MAGGKDHEGSSSKQNNRWLSRIQNRFELKDYIKSAPSSDVCIYRVPELLIGGKLEAYRPRFVYFGPFHHKEHQGLMEDHKLEALHKTEQRFKDKSKTIKDLITEIKLSHNKIRDCYEGRAIEYDEETLAWMMTMDGCFILEFLRAVYAKEEERFSLIFNSGKVDNSIQCGILNDILKLENQIPLFILTTILEWELPTPPEVKLTEILYKCSLFHYYPFKTNKDAKQILRTYHSYLSRSDGDRACHLLDVCRNVIQDFLIQTPETTDKSRPENCVLSLFKNACCGQLGGPEEDPDSQLRGPEEDPNSQLRGPEEDPDSQLRGPEEDANSQLRGPEEDPESQLRGPEEDSDSHVYEIPRAELLHNAGIQFKASVKGHLRFEKRSLRSSTLFLPRIVIEENKTETMLRNLIIFEECEKRKKKDSVISNYISFMNRLIDSEKDVALLAKEGIIINWLGRDEEVAALFNILDKEALVGGIEKFIKVAKDVRAEYNRKPKVLMSQFIEEHFSKPWYVVSLVAAMLILVMTAIQTVYSVKK